MEARLIEALQPIRYFALAANLYHLFESGLYDSLSSRIRVDELCARHAMDRARLSVFLTYLKNEGYVETSSEGVILSARGRDLGEFRGWYTMLLGGYGRTFLELGDKLLEGSGEASRSGEKVGIGSADISQYDTIPLIETLLEKIPDAYSKLIDLGCGDARHLMNLLREPTSIAAIWGVEPNRGAVASAQEMIRARGLEERMRVYCADAIEFLANESFRETPDVVLLTFVLQEILGQEGERATVSFLEALGERFSRAHVLIIEVDDRHGDPSVMRHGLSLAYYNPYYLLHPFTNQQLESCAYWEKLFGTAGYEVRARATTKATVDSTGLTVGYLLRRSQ